jgi:lantibiotic modifying enzyme
VEHATANTLEEPHEWDLLSGVAGAVAGIVVLHGILGDPSLLEAAARLGDALIQAADRSDDGYSWKSKRFPQQRNLTGFSRGAAGIGFALLELFQATGDAHYLKAARHALQYERSWFDSQAGNWPDFRGVPARGKQARRPLIFGTYWCQGAPGIALSRLHAYQVLNEEAYRDEAIAALQTTQAALEAALCSGASNFSLCHGLAGNAEALCYGSQTLGEEWAKAKALAVEVAQAGIARHSQGQVAPWPCGSGGGETPGLMLGLAGIGYFYLRLYDPAIPSILMPRRQCYLAAGADASRLKLP